MFGAIAGKHRDKTADKVLMWLSGITTAIPSFWLVLVAVMLFGFTFKLFPYRGAMTAGYMLSMNGSLFAIVFMVGVVIIIGIKIIIKKSIIGEASASSYKKETTSKEEENTTATGNFAISAGTYNASYIKESAMAGTVEYIYSAEIGADGTFSYKVRFDMGNTTYDGSTANGTYIIDGNKFVFTDSEGTVTEGTLIAENTLVISLMASAMAKEPYEVTFVIQ